MLERTIVDWCTHLEIRNYTINGDGIVDVNGLVTICAKVIGKIPIQFGITERFNCSECELKTLEGAPNKVVKNGFYCSYNLLQSLEYGPKIVYGDYMCRANKLMTLKGGPIKVTGDFSCGGNYITTLENCPKEIGGDFICVYNPIYVEYSKFKSYEQYLRFNKLNMFLENNI
jgi:hypothetical protein